MNNRAVLVLDEDGFSTTFEPLLIVSLEPHKNSGRGGNGSAKKGRK